MARRFPLHILTVALALAVLTPAHGQVLDENFNSVTGQGGGTVLVGPGFGLLTSWDDGLTGENAFAGTTGNANFGDASAYGTTNGGVDGTGAGVIDVQDVTFDLVRESFAGATGTGGGVFLAGDGTADTFNYTTNWDDGLVNEGAFGGTYGGAVLEVGGSMSAEGLPAGGMDGAGGGRIAVNSVTLNSGNWYAGLQWEIGPLPGATPLLNPGFDDGLNDWNAFSNAYSVPDYEMGITALSPPNVLKMFGPFSGSYGVAGVYQDLDAEPGQTWQIHCYVQHPFGDSISGSPNFVEMGIEFYDSDGAQILTQFGTILDGNSPTDIWLDPTPVQAVAPAGTVTARAVLLFNQPDGGSAGASAIDDVTFEVVGGTPSVDLNDFSLSADVMGAASAGQALGAYQLRLEDSDGNRLIFYGTADGSWQSIGGNLGTATEADADGNPASDVFNVNSPWFRVVVAFDNEAQSWGSGGSLDVDNVLLANTDPAGSAWYAGLFWNNLTLPTTDPSQLVMTADVMGDVPGGGYQIRLEALQSVLAGIDENFSNAKGDCGESGVCNFFSYDDYLAGTTFGYTNDWDTGVEGEGAFGGLVGLSEILPGGGFFAEALTDGGTDGTGGGRIEARDIAVGPGGGWYAGLDWGPQALASTDLSQVTLEADIRGTPGLGGPYGVYELRIEDAQGDRLYFQATADGTWQHIGGTLDTAAEGAAIGGGGDGTFDLDSPSYNVAIAFYEPQDTWGFGGILDVDNLYLTPAATTREIGRIAFHGVSDGTFQSIGGLLSDGVTNLGDTMQDFESGTGTGGGQFYYGGIVGGLPWDDGLENETAFAGVWGSGSLGSASAQVCTGCGVDGSKAGQLVFEDAAYGAAGGWWAGLAFGNVVVDLSAGEGDNLAALSDIDFSAMVKGTIDSGAGQTYGRYVLRLEDNETDFLAFELVADGTWQAIGGPLSTATRGQTPDGNGSFNYFQGVYGAVLVVEGGDGYDTWGTGGTLTIDDLHISGTSLADADTYTVTVTFEDEVSTWGTNGRLVVDNLYLGAPPSGCAGDYDCSGAIDFFDIDLLLAALGGEQAWTTKYEQKFGTAPSCDYLANCDANGDGTVDFFDIDAFLGLLGSSCP